MEEVSKMDTLIEIMKEMSKDMKDMKVYMQVLTNKLSGMM